MMTVDEKEFVITHVFKDVSSMKKEKDQLSPNEEHFGVPWSTSIKRGVDYLQVYLCCLEERKDKEWSIEVLKEIQIRAKNRETQSRAKKAVFKSTDENEGWGLKFIKWDDLMKDYVIDDSVTVEFRVKIKRMTGINLRKFDESTKELSDVVLVVENQKFYVSKLLLASQSPFFKSTLLKLSESEGLPEHTLEDVNAKDFQTFLELVHGENPIDESTVAGIAHLASLYGAEMAIQKCERFLIENTKKSLKEKLQLAHRYNLQKLRDHCLSNISTVTQIRSVLTEDLREMDPLVSGALLQTFMVIFEEFFYMGAGLFVFFFCVLFFLCIRIVFG